MNKSHRHSSRRARDVIIIALMTLALFIPLAELTLRTLCSYCAYTERNQGPFVSPYALNEHDPYLLRPPNTVSRYQQPEFDYEVKTNSLGLRDVEHPLAKPPGELRILAIGDSFTEGQGARFEQTWLSQLGGMLNAGHHGGHFRIMCGGSAASDPFFGYRVLVDKLLVYQPDFVLLVVNHSDIMDVIVRGGMERFLPDGRVKAADPPELIGLYESSHLARFVLFELFDYTHYIIPRSERDKRARHAVEKTSKLISEYQRLLESEGIDFTLVTLPFRGELRRNAYDKLDLLKEFAVRDQIDVIDTKPYLYARLLAHDSRLEQLYWPKDNHFTELGYRYFAEAVAAGLAPKLDRALARIGRPSDQQL